MKRLLTAGIALLVCTGSALAETIYWDNFRGDTYDTSNLFTSERDTQHSAGKPSASWAVDDFAVPFGEGFEAGEDQGDELSYNLTSVEWVGARQLDGDRLGYDRLDWAILTRTFDEFTGLFDFTPVEYAPGQMAVFTDQMIDVDWSIDEELGSVGDLAVYRGSLQTSIPLDPDTEYWVGVRLIGNDDNGDAGAAGRHFIASGGGETLFEDADSAFRFDPPRGGDPWQPIVNPISGEEFEASYRLGFDVVPEPTTLALLGLGGLALLRRR